MKKSTLLASIALALPMLAQATTSTSTFNFYSNGGSLFDTLSSDVNYTAGDLSVNIQAFDGYGLAGGTDVAVRWDGIGASSGLLDVGELTSSLTPYSGEMLYLTFNQAVNLSSLQFSMWENGPLFNLLDHAVVSWDSGSKEISNKNTGFIVKSFDFGGVTTTHLTIQATGGLTSFRLAGITATAAVPELPTMGLMAIGLVGLGVARRRQQRQ